MLRWIEGFEALGTSGASGAPLELEFQRKYTDAETTSGITSSLDTGRGGGLALKWTSSAAGTHYLKKTFNSQATWIIGFAIKTASPLPTDDSLVDIIDGATVQIRLSIDVDGLKIYRGPNTTLLNSVTGIFQAGAWYYIELKVTINNTTGSYYVKVNEVTKMSATGVDTQESANATANRITFPNTPNGYIDDLYILDGAGSLNNDFLNEVKVGVIYPNSDSGDAQWLLSTGSDHYALVDENPANDDTDYVYSDTLNDLDLYNFQDATGFGATIFGIQINTHARVTDAASRDLLIPIKSDTTVNNGSTYTVSSTSYMTFTRVSETNPHTSTLWTTTTLNAALFGVKVAS